MQLLADEIHDLVSTQPCDLIPAENSSAPRAELPFSPYCWQRGDPTTDLPKAPLWRPKSKDIIDSIDEVMGDDSGVTDAGTGGD